MPNFSSEEVEVLLQLSRDATAGDSFEERLGNVAEHLGALVPVSSMSLVVIGGQGDGGQGAPGRMVCRNVDPESLRSYALQYRLVDPMVIHAPLCEDRVVCLSDFVPASQFGRDEFTSDFLRTQGIRHVLGLAPVMPDGSFLSLGLHRDRALGDFTTRERELIRLARVDIARAGFAMLLREKVDRLGAQAARPDAGQGALVFDALGDVLRADAGALALCALLGGGQGRFPADLFVQEVRRLAAIGAGAASERPYPLAGGGRVLVRLDAVDGKAGTEVVAVLRHDRAATPERLEAAAERFRLTPRERQVAALAVDGLGNRHIGHKLGMSEITVGTHLTKIFRKTGVSNRTELARAFFEG